MAALGEQNICGNHGLKLAINSHVAYARHRPLHTLFESLLDTGFTRFEDVLVLLGGSASNTEPQLLNLTTLLPHLGYERQVTVIETTANAVDYHGLSLLYRHRGHPRVAAAHYLFIHDTVVFDRASFVRRFESFRLPRSPYVFTTWPLPNSNVVVIGANVINVYGHNFDGNVSKRDAFFNEFGYPLLRPEKPPVQPLIHFGLVVKVGPRIVNGTADVYGTGAPRIRFWYPAFGLYKFSLRSDAAGDILHGTTKPLFGGRRWFPPKDATLARVRFGQRPGCWLRCHDEPLRVAGSPNPLILPVCTSTSLSTNRQPATPPTKLQPHQRDWIPK